jgi:hypothetical protein
MLALRVHFGRGNAVLVAQAEIAAANEATPVLRGPGRERLSRGNDANGDQGRDKMPESKKSVMPLSRQPKPKQ